MGVPLWRRQEFKEVRLFDQLVHRFSLYQPPVRHLDRVCDSDLGYVMIRSVMQQPSVNELVVRPTVELRVGLVK